MLKIIVKKAINYFGFDVSKIERRENIYFQKDAWEHQEKHLLPFHKEGMLVIDIGAGGTPSPIASILTDYYPDDSVHRSKSVDESKPLVICSVESMPFKNNIFDLSICSHVLEHVSTPELAASEISRISISGYVETPAYGKDTLIGTADMHEWQVVENCGCLHFFPYTKRQKEANKNSPFMNIWSQKKYHPLQQFFWERTDVFNVNYIWHESMQVVAHRKSESGPKNSLKSAWQPIDQSRLPNTSPLLTANEIQLLEKCLVAPDGFSNMKYSEGSFWNEDGSTQYPVRGKRVYFELGR